jgi:hypothetical protein
LQFDATQTFDAPTERVVAIYADAATYEKLGQQGKLSAPELVSHDEDEGGVVRIALRYRYVGDLPGGAGRFVKSDRLSWVQDSRFDLSAGTQSIAILPDNYADRFRASAEATTASSASGATRRVTGEVRIRIPLVGGKVERAIVEGLVEHLDEEATAIAALLR